MFGVGDHQKDRQISVVVEREMQLDRPLGPPEDSPWERFGAEVDDRGIDTEQLVLEPKLPWARDLATAVEQLVEHRAEQDPGPMFVRIRQRRALRRRAHAELLQLPFAAGQASANLAQRLGFAQVAKQHRDELRPTVEPACVPFCSRGDDGALKIGPRKELEQLIEDAAESHDRGWPPC